MSAKYPWQEDEGQLGLPNYGMAYGGYQPQPAPSYTPSSTNPQVQQQPASGSVAGYAGLGLQAIGTGLNAYGAYEQGKQADRNFDAQKDAYEFDQAISLEDRERMEEERRRMAEMEAGNYAGNYLDRAIKGYGNYSSMRG